MSPRRTSARSNRRQGHVHGRGFSEPSLHRRGKADARLLNASSLTCVEAILTGESEAIAKSPETLDQPELPLGDRTQERDLYGTNVAAGSGHAVVVATGMQTEIGGIATLIGDAGVPIDVVRCPERRHAQHWW